MWDGKNQTCLIFMIGNRGGSDQLRSRNIVVLTPHTCGVFGQLTVGEQNMDRAVPTD